MDTTKDCHNCLNKNVSFAKEPCFSCDIKTSHNWQPVTLTAAEYIKTIDATVPELGVKFDSAKPKWSLMPRGVLSQVVEVMTIGAKKYSPDNWMHVDPARYYDALNRHVDAWRNGERLDEETGKHHLAHALCCLIFMLWHDDNPKKASE